MTNNKEKCCNLCKDMKPLPCGFSDGYLIRCPCHTSPASNEKKIPCDCPKGGMFENGNVCKKCGGSEWVTPVSNDKPEHDGTCRIPECYKPVSNKKCDHAHCRCMNLDKQCPNKHYADCIKPSPIAESEGNLNITIDKWYESLPDEPIGKRIWRVSREELQAFIRQLLSRHNQALVEAVNALREKEGLIVIGFDGKTKTAKITEDGYEKLEEHFRIIGKNSALDAVIEIIKPKV